MKRHAPLEATQGVQFASQEHKRQREGSGLRIRIARPSAEEVPSGAQSGLSALAHLIADRIVDSRADEGVGPRLEDA